MTRRNKKDLGESVIVRVGKMDHPAFCVENSEIRPGWQLVEWESSRTRDWVLTNDVSYIMSGGTRRLRRHQSPQEAPREQEKPTNPSISTAATNRILPPTKKRVCAKSIITSPKASSYNAANHTYVAKEEVKESGHQDTDRSVGRERKFAVQDEEEGNYTGSGNNNQNLAMEMVNSSHEDSRKRPANMQVEGKDVDGQNDNDQFHVTPPRKQMARKPQSEDSAPSTVGQNIPKSMPHLLDEERMAIQMQFLQDHPEANEPQFNIILNEYLRFIVLKIEEAKYAPSLLVDTMWRAHIVCTRSYFAFMDRYNHGNYIHHEDDGRYDLTLQAYRTKFGEPDCRIWPGVDQEVNDQDANEELDESGEHNMMI